MKYAILADIHANLDALEAVLADIEKHGGVDCIWCLGDIVGYGPDPRQCIEIIRERCSDCVAGNHDWAAAGKISASLFNIDASAAVSWTAAQLSEEDIRYLRGLPEVMERDRFTLVHGSPIAPLWEYVLSSTDAKVALKHFKTPYCFVGHSHLPLLFECGGSTTYCKLVDTAPGYHLMLGTNRLLINPGSVGQPRDHDPRAAYAILDMDLGRVTWQRVEYNVAAVQDRMVHAGLPESLIQRLKSGR